MLEQIGYIICIPFAWLTRLFYSLTGSYGVALILFTLVVKLVLLPFQLKSKKSMLRMNRMQDKVKHCLKAMDEIMGKQPEYSALVPDTRRLLCSLHLSALPHIPRGRATATTTRQERSISSAATSR